MKKIVLFFIILISQLVSCQTVVPLNTFPTPNGVYKKDINNSYSKYLGTWEGVLNNKKYTFTFVKFTKYLHNWNANSFDYRDELMGKYKVVDLATNTVVYDNTTAINFEDYRINSANPNVARGLCAFVFTDTDANCRNSLEFYLIGIAGQPTKLRYTGASYTDSWEQDNCSYITQGNIPVYLPKQEFILTKLP